MVHLDNDERAKRHFSTKPSRSNAFENAVPDTQANFCFLLLPRKRETLRRRPRRSEKMSNAPSETSTRQELVYLDVGGTPFKMLRSTVLNYPTSLIAKVLSEFPQAGHESQPVYVDRNPELFNWIVEIYRCTSYDPFCWQEWCFRGGEYIDARPRDSVERLQRELDFYQLPSLKELGLSGVPSAPYFSIEVVAKKMMQDIMNEIVKSSLEEMFPWRVFIYYHFSVGVLRPRRGILVIPEAVWDDKLIENLNFIKDRGHGAFVRLLNEQSSYYPGATFRPSLSSTRESRFTLWPPTENLIRMLKEEARCFGLLPEIRNLENWRDSTTPRKFSFRDLPFLGLRPLGY